MQIWRPQCESSTHSQKTHLNIWSSIGFCPGSIWRFGLLPAQHSSFHGSLQWLDVVVGGSSVVDISVVVIVGLTLLHTWKLIETCKGIFKHSDLTENYRRGTKIQLDLLFSTFGICNAITMSFTTLGLGRSIRSCLWFFRFILVPVNRVAASIYGIMTIRFYRCVCCRLYGTCGCHRCLIRRMIRIFYMITKTSPRWKVYISFIVFLKDSIHHCLHHGENTHSSLLSQSGFVIFGP